MPATPRDGLRPRSADSLSPIICATIFRRAMATSVYPRRRRPDELDKADFCRLWRFAATTSAPYREHLAAIGDEEMICAAAALLASGDFDGLSLPTPRALPLTPPRAFAASMPPAESSPRLAYDEFFPAASGNTPARSR